jgi:hypothetical protein
MARKRGCCRFQGLRWHQQNTDPHALFLARIIKNCKLVWLYSWALISTCIIKQMLNLSTDQLNIQGGLFCGWSVKGTKIINNVQFKARKYYNQTIFIIFWSTV